MKLLTLLVVLAVVFALFYLANKRYTRRAPGPHNYGERGSQTRFYSSGAGGGGYPDDGGGDGGS